MESKDTLEYRFRLPLTCANNDWTAWLLYEDAPDVPQNLYVRGDKRYELTNHLGNVLATITDRRRHGQSLAVGTPVVAWFAETANAQMYWPFGAVVSEYQYTAAWAGNYRYGFNGKEYDPEWGNQYDYGFRIYNPQVARFLSVDPLASSFPMLTPYQFASNNPIVNIDLDGLEGTDFRVNSPVVGARLFALLKAGDYAEVDRVLSRNQSVVMTSANGPEMTEYLQREYGYFAVEPRINMLGYTYTMGQQASITNRILVKVLKVPECYKCGYTEHLLLEYTTPVVGPNSNEVSGGSGIRIGGTDDALQALTQMGGPTNSYTTDEEASPANGIQGDSQRRTSPFASDDGSPSPPPPAFKFRNFAPGNTRGEAYWDSQSAPRGLVEDARNYSWSKEYGYHNGNTVVGYTAQIEGSSGAKIRHHITPELYEQVQGSR